MFKVHNVVVPTDFSKISSSAFEYARSIAEQYSANIHLIYVLEKTPPFLAMRSLDISEDKVMASMEEQANIALQEVKEKFQESSSLNIIPVLKKGVDYEEIISYSKDINADLIVIATHGRTGILYTLLGSVAEKVIRHSKIPVLVIAPPEDNQ